MVYACCLDCCCQPNRHTNNAFVRIGFDPLLDASEECWYFEQSEFMFRRLSEKTHIFCMVLTYVSMIIVEQCLRSVGWEVVSKLCR